MKINLIIGYQQWWWRLYGQSENDQSNKTNCIINY